MKIDWNYLLVFISVLVAVIGSLTAMTHAERMRQSTGKAANLWMSIGAFTLGLTIWSMHFIGMLAFHIDTSLNFDLSLTLASVLPATIAAFIGFHELRTQDINFRRIFIAGVVMGIGIAMMHYTGMAALRMFPAIHYPKWYFFLSILIAIVASWGALLIMYQGKYPSIPRFLRFGLGSVVMGVAISGMHYTAMQGMVIVSGSVCLADESSVSHEVLTVAVTLTSLFWFGGGILAALFDNRLAQQNAIALTQLQEAHQQLQTSANILAESMTRDLRESERKMYQVVHAALDCIVMVDKHGKLIEFNPAAESTFGYHRAQILGKNLTDLIIPETYRAAHSSTMEHVKDLNDTKVLGKRMNLTALRSDGTQFPIELTLTRLDWQSEYLLVGFIRDITERQQYENEIRQLAFYDPLTHLPNRRLLYERIEHLLMRRAHQFHHTALFFIDLDKFKEMNDVYGHDVGDMFLVEIASRLKACVRMEDTVSRLGGDEFIVMLEDLDVDLQPAIEETLRVARKIQSVLRTPYKIHGIKHSCTSSIGIDLFIDGEHTGDELIKNADAAMYQAKQSGKNTIKFFDAKMQSWLDQTN